MEKRDMPMKQEERIWPEATPEDLRMVGFESGKNSIFRVVFGCMQYLTDVISMEQKARIVLDYDPDALNWTMQVFTAKDAPIPEDIR